MRRVLNLLSTLFLLSVAVTPALNAQTPTTGRITGRVIDAASGAGLSDAGIQVVGTTLGTMSGVDGRFTLPAVPAGTVTLQVRRIGYAPKTITGLFLDAGKALVQDIALAQASVQLTAQVVTADAERGSVNAALDQQKNSVNVVSSITSEQIAKSPDGDAAQAVGRVSGVSVQDGKYVFVRGLGDRYTQTSLNGARIPSPEPEKKVVPLDLFPTGLLQTITTIKTFTPDQPGDFSGATVDIQTKEFPAQRTWAMSTSTGASEAVLGRNMAMPGRVRGDLFAIGAGPRALPSFVQQFGNFSTSLPGQSDYNRMVSEFRNSWTPREQEGGLNGSTSISVGGNDPVFGQRIGYLISGTYSYAQEARVDQRRALALATTGAEATEIDRFSGNTGKSSVLWGGMANFSTLLGGRTRLALNNTYNRTMDSEARNETGFSENLGIPFNISRLKYVERSVRASQLMLQSDLTANQKIELAVSATGVERLEPDRSEFVQAIFNDPNTGQPMAPQWFSASNEGAVRTFSDLSEQAYEARGHYRIQFGEVGRSLAIKVGGLGRYASRDANSSAYSINASGISQADRELAAETIFDGRYTSPTDNVWRVTPIGVGGSYTASDYLGAGFAMLEKEFGPRWQLITGARAEYSDVLVKAVPTVGAVSSTNPSFLDVLPAIALTFRPSDAVNFRASASQTVSRPEYRELAPIQYREVIGFDNVLGNPDLKRALIQNYDLRWEWYPNAGEVVSVALFAKRFTNPIERVYRGSSGTRIITFVNADGADNYGIELEGRKNLDFIAEALANFSISANATVMQSDIRLAGQSIAVTNSNRPMVGQAPYMFNTGLTWTSNAGSSSATLLYNVVGARITDAGEVPLPDVKERERHIVDFSLRLPVNSRVSARLDARNLLDAPYRFEQGPVTRETYRIGRSYTVGFSWKP
jgi:outer membrane receptor protein involved in Fe transport